MEAPPPPAPGRSPGSNSETARIAATASRIVGSGHPSEDLPLATLHASMADQIAAPNQAAPMNDLVDVAGYAASLLVFSAFYMTAMTPLRAIAIASNVAFIAYGLGRELYPVLLLHAVLLPLKRRPPAPDARGHRSGAGRVSWRCLHRLVDPADDALRVQVG